MQRPDTAPTHASRDRARSSWSTLSTPGSRHESGFRPLRAGHRWRRVARAESAACEDSSALPACLAVCRASSADSPPALESCTAERAWIRFTFRPQPCTSPLVSPPGGGAARAPAVQPRPRSGMPWRDGLLALAATTHSSSSRTRGYVRPSRERYGPRRPRRERAGSRSFQYELTPHPTTRSIPPAPPRPSPSAPPHPRGRRRRRRTGRCASSARARGSHALPPQLTPRHTLAPANESPTLAHDRKQSRARSMHAPSMTARPHASFSRDLRVERARTDDLTRPHTTQRLRAAPPRHSPFAGDPASIGAPARFTKRSSHSIISACTCSTASRER